MTIDYNKLVTIIAVKAHSTRDEAWSGLSTAYLTLDQTRPEKERIAHLLKVGVLAVKSEVHAKYTDYTNGVLRCEPLIQEPESVDERTAEQLANDIGRALGLSGEAVGVIRSIADGECGTSTDAIRWLLRKKGIANTRVKTREVHDALRRIQTQ